MKRKELAQKLLNQLNTIEDTEEKIKWIESFCNEIIDSYWINNYIIPMSDPNNPTLGTYGCCGLCGGCGVIHSKGFTPVGVPIDNKLFCICPNGQNLRKLGRDPNLCFCPNEKDFK